jgi:RimJ/RimL family protein N-acetyltransferase
MRHDAFVAINVLRDYWGAGIGRSLLERTLVWARNHNIRRLSAGVQGHNRRGLRFAGAAGFEQEVVSPRYAVIDGRAVDHIRLGKLLDER